MNKAFLNKQIEYYKQLENHYRASFEKYPNATNNDYMKGYANAIRDIISDLKLSGIIEEATT